MKAILSVGAEGFIGSVLRYWFFSWLFRVFHRPWFPAGTLAVTLLGCLLIGLLAGLAEQRRVFDPQILSFVFVAILSGFTNFSAFAYKAATLLHNQRVHGACLKVGLQVYLGLAAVGLGGLLSRLA